MEVFQENKWKCLKRTKDNFFIADSSNIKVPVSYELNVRITSVAGESLETSIKKIGSNGQLLNTNVQYKKFAEGLNLVFVIQTGSDKSKPLSIFLPK